MVKGMSYGRCLTQEEFDSEVEKIFKEVASGTARKQPQEEISIKEFNLLIDFKLGVDFPEEKRKVLVELRKRVQMYHVQLGKRFQAGELSDKEFATEVQRKIPAMMVEEFAKILSPEELNKLFDITEGQVPEIPIDHTKLSR